MGYIWKNRSNHSFGITWVKGCKLLGYNIGEFSEDLYWSKIFNKFYNTLNLWKSRSLSFKGKSTILNSLCVSKILYYISAAIVPNHYITLFQRSCFRFMWNSTFEPVKRTTLYLPFKEGGLNVPNILLKIHTLYLKHVQKIINNHEALWVYFAKYWISIQLRHLKADIYNNLTPHSEVIPEFYKNCLDVLKPFTETFSDVSINGLKTRQFYELQLNAQNYEVKVLKIFIYVDYKTVFKNIYLPFIDPCVRNTMWKIAHDVVYVNYYLKSRHMTKDDKCPMCKTRIETINHMLLECKTVQPLNKIVLKLINSLSEIKIKLSECIFRFCSLPYMSRYHGQIALLLLTYSRHLIWVSRNESKHENKDITDYILVSKFLSKIKFRITIDHARLNQIEFIELWCMNGFCTLDVLDNIVTFHDSLDVSTYFQLMPKDK